MTFAFWLSFVVFLLAAALLLEVAIGARKIRYLKNMPPWPGPHVPRVSIIVAALNEANTIEPALQSVLALDYPNLEIIAINDRSTDGTPAILDRMALRHPRLRVLHIDALPRGWLGKNHALYRGAQLASGDYLIFTDADVVWEPTAVSRAVGYCERNGIDHLALLFDVIARTSLLTMMLLGVTVGFLARYKPWKVGASPRHFIGVGAFNMVRAPAYRRAGGHAAIPLAVIDDMMLGKLMKTRGCHQQVLYGQGLVSVEWYRSTSDMIRGMEKNIFAAFDYQLVQLAIVTLLVVVLRVWPWIGLFATGGATRWLNAATVVAGLLLYIDILRTSGWSYRCLLFSPVVSLIELAMWWRGCLLTLARGGIEWRGTRYALEELRKAHRT